MSIELGRPFSETGAGVKGENGDSIQICLTGKEVFTKYQFELLDKTLHNIMVFVPDLKVYPHNYFNKKKTCPNFKSDWFIYKNQSLNN